MRRRLLARLLPIGVLRLTPNEVYWDGDGYSPVLSLAQVEPPSGCREYLHARVCDGHAYGQVTVPWEAYPALIADADLRCVGCPQWGTPGRCTVHAARMDEERRARALLRPVLPLWPPHPEWVGPGLPGTHPPEQRTRRLPNPESAVWPDRLEAQLDRLFAALARWGARYGRLVGKLAMLALLCLGACWVLLIPTILLLMLLEVIH